MTEIARRDEKGLIIHIANEEPLTATVVGDLLTALNNDYKRQTGRNLAIVTVRVGTLTAILSDIHGIVVYGNDLFDFAKNVGETLLFAVGGGVLWRSRKKGAKGAQAILEAAVKSTAQVDLAYKGADGEILIASVTPAEAVQYNKRRIYRPQRVRLRADEPAGLKRERERLLEEFARAAVENHPDQPLGIGSNGLTDPLREILRIVVEGARETHQGRDMLIRVATRLRNQGYGEAANILTEGM